MENRFSKFTLLISSINRCINKIKSEEMSEFDLKSYHVSCLYYLYKNQSTGLTASELCTLCEDDKGTISRSINYLMDCGYIICDDTSKKKYRAKLHLTESGKSIAYRIDQIADNIVDRASEGLSEEDRLVLYKSLEYISNNLVFICDNYGGKNSN